MLGSGGDFIRSLHPATRLSTSGNMIVSSFFVSEGLRVHKEDWGWGSRPVAHSIPKFLSDEDFNKVSTLWTIPLNLPTVAGGGLCVVSGGERIAYLQHL